MQINVLFSGEVFRGLGVFFRTFIVVFGLKKLLCVISLGPFRSQTPVLFPSDKETHLYLLHIFISFFCLLEKKGVVFI